MLSLFAAGTQAGTVQYVYDGLGRLIAVIDPAGDTTRYSYDAAGNLLSVTRNSSSQLSIISFAPTRGGVGESVAIFGSGFVANTAQNTVAFNGTSAVVTSATTTQLVATVPAGATTGPISVTNVNGSAVSAQSFTVVPAPIISSVTPSYVQRGVTTSLVISGSHLASARSVTFTQAGITAAIRPGGTDQSLPISLTVTGAVPFGSYAFSVTNDIGSTTQSGSVTVTVTAVLVGEAMSVTRPLSVHVPAAIPGAPAGNAMSVTRPLSVHLPSVIPGAPQGNAISATVPLSVHLPAVIPGAPDGNAISATVPLSVHLPAVISGAPAGNAMSVTEPLSVLRP